MKLLEHISYLEQVLKVQGNIEVTFGGASEPVVRIQSTYSTDPLKNDKPVKVLVINSGNPIRS